MDSAPAAAPAFHSAVLEAILSFAKHAPVFPCNPLTKAPLVERGFHAATRDGAVIRQWWDQWPNALVGVPMGGASGLVAIDYDDYKHDALSAEWIAENTAALLAARVHHTPQGGRHYLFRLPEGTRACTVAGATLNGRKRVAIDLRGDGGYICWWPLHGCAIANDSAPLLPDDLRAALLDQTPQREATESADRWIQLFERSGQYIRQIAPGKHAVRCLWEDEHTSPSSESGTVLLEPYFEQRRVHGFSCMHAHCSGRSMREVRKFFGVDSENGIGWGFAMTAKSHEHVDWLWPQWLARGELHLLAGRSGVSKTALALTLAAAFSRGGELPGGGRAQQCAVAVLSFEDHIQRTIVPRLEYAGADLDNIEILPPLLTRGGEERIFDADLDMDLLTERLAKIAGLGLFIVDPLDLALSIRDAHNAHEVRHSLAPWVRLCRDLNIALTGVKHFVKGDAFGSVIDRVSGSYAFVAASRMVWVAERVRRMVDGNTQDVRVLTRGKSNLGVDGGGWEYTLDAGCLPPPAPPGIEAVRVKWGAAVVGRAEEVLQSVMPEETRALGERDRAAAFLSALLAKGPMGAGLVRQEAERAGFNFRTVERAANYLGVTKQKLKTEWSWALPPAQGDKTTRTRV